MTSKIKNLFKNYTILSGDSNENEDSFNRPCPEDTANILSRISFLWIQSIVLKGYRSPLQLNDVFNLPNSLKMENHLSYMKKLNLFSSKSKYPLIKHCFIDYTKRNYLTVVFKFIFMFGSILIPILLRALLSNLQDTNSTPSTSIGFCFLIFTVSIITVISEQFGYWFGLKSTLQIRGALVSTIYEKIFKMNNSSRKKYTSGKIMNLISIDVDTFFEFFWNNHCDIIFYPTQIIVLLILLVRIIGFSGLFGFLVMVIGIPLAGLSSSTSMKFYLASLNQSDERVSIIGELISGIRFLKLYAWEKSFLNRIEEQRNLQLKNHFKVIVFWFMTSLFSQCLSSISLLVSFSVYTGLLGHQLTSVVAFTSLTIFVNLRRPLEMLPDCIQRLLKLYQSSKRIESFLKSPEKSYANVRPIDINSSNKDVLIENGCFTWDDENVYSERNEEIGDGKEFQYNDDNDSNTINLINMNRNNGDQENNDPKLSNINFRAPYGKLTIICGPVGCGKTTLIQSLIGEIHRLSGTVQCFDNVGFTTQQPFLLSSSLRENILFGKEYNREWYLKVLQSCALDVDLSQLPARDLTEIGERGINLSGGQKSRIALARAIYANPDCLILDDPLNAVDSEVAKHLFDNCLQGIMANKTRILVTHQLQFLQSADYIAVFKDDNIIQGTYEELKEKGINFESILKSKQLEIEKEEEEDIISNENTHHFDKKDIPPIEELVSDKMDPNLIEKAKLVIQEDRSEGAVGLKTYLPYIKAGGSYLYFGFVVFIYTVSQVVFQGSDYWLAVWTDQAPKGINPNSYYLKIYMGLIICFLLLIMCRYLLLGLLSLSSARVLHNTLLTKVTYAPCLFFDSNPSGRILNRFSKDIADIDTRLLPAGSDFMYCFLYVIMSMLMMIIITPWIALPVSGLMVLYFIIQKIYRASSRDLCRMESISRSPMYSLLSESFNGLTPICSLNQHNRFIKEFQDRVDINQRLYYYSFAVHRWLGVRLEAIASFSVLLASLFATLSHVDPGFASLIITTSLGITGFLSWCIRQYSELEVKMNSVDRVLSYINTPSEESTIINKHKSLDIPPTIINSSWPEKGNISFKNLEIKYRENLDPVIKDISFDINQNEKIGIVGRTGAGKSSLGWSLFRLVEANKGSIIIDDVDISRVSLYDLRSRLGVVPQDPFIFSGTFRLNLDPFNQYTDDEIWNSLEKVQLKKMIEQLPNKLNSSISECGDGLSVGEKQLLCLCRALLRNSKIVLFDEASASLDYYTDSIIKKVIRSNFQNSTILTIAHRLDTIIDSDRILVVDAGKLIEFDSPKNLMSDPNSKFSKLVLAQSNHFK